MMIRCGCCAPAFVAELARAGASTAAIRAAVSELAWCCNDVAAHGPRRTSAGFCDRRGVLRACWLGWEGSGYSSPDGRGMGDSVLCHVAGRVRRPAFGLLYGIAGYCPSFRRCGVVGF